MPSARCRTGVNGFRSSSLAITIQQGRAGCNLWIVQRTELKERIVGLPDPEIKIVQQMPKGKKKEGKMEKDETPPGYRRLELREVIQDGDLAIGKDTPIRHFAKIAIPAIWIGSVVEEDDCSDHYRPIPQELAPLSPEATKKSQWVVEFDEKILPTLFASSDGAYEWLEQNKKSSGLYWVREVLAW